MRSCKRGWGEMEIGVLRVLLTGLTDTSREESPEILDRYIPTVPSFRAVLAILKSYLISFLLLSSFLPFPHRRPSTSTSP